MLHVLSRPNPIVGYYYLVLLLLLLLLLGPTSATFVVLVVMVVAVAKFRFEYLLRRRGLHLRISSSLAPCSEHSRRRLAISR